MDTTQLLLTVVLTISTVFLVIIGIQLIFILKDLRQILKKANRFVDGLEKIGLTVEHGFSDITGFISGIKTLFGAINSLHNKKSGKTR